MERNIKLLGLFNFFTDFKFHAAVLIIYFAHVTGSYVLATSLFSVVMISSALLEIPTGIFSDLIGRKKTIIFGAAAATISAILYAAGLSYWPLFIGALFEGLSRAWYSGNNEALLYESVSESNSKEAFAHHLGRTSSMFQLALMFGAVIGSVIANWSFSVVMWVSVIPQIVSLGIAFFLTDPKFQKREKSNIFSHLKISTLHIWKNKRLLLISITNIVGFGVGESAFQFNAAFIATLWPIWAIGISRMFTFLGAFASFWFSGKWIKKFGEYNILIIANIYTRIANVISYGFPTLYSPFIMTTSSVFYGTTQVAKSTLMQQEYTQEQRATLASITSLVGNIFYGIFAIILGYTADILGPAKALLMVQGIMLSLLIIYFKLKKT